LTLGKVLPEYVSLVRAVPGVERLANENGTIMFHTSDAAHVNPEVVRGLVQAGADVLSLQLESLGLEEAYLHVMRNVDGSDVARDPAGAH